MLDVENVGCLRYGMSKMSNVWDVGCLICEIFGLWGVLDMEFFGYGMFGMCDV